jgi:hypothetical protein
MHRYMRHKGTISQKKIVMAFLQLQLQSRHRCVLFTLYADLKVLLVALVKLTSSTLG